MPTVVAERRIAPRLYAEYHAALYRPSARKALFFALAEGVGGTWRKYWSKRVERRIRDAETIVVARLTDAGGRVLIGITRDLGGPLRFDPGLVFEATPDVMPDAVQLPAEVLALLESWAPVPTCPSPAELPQSILAANPLLSVPGAPATVGVVRGPGNAPPGAVWPEGGRGEPGRDGYAESRSGRRTTGSGPGRRGGASGGAYLFGFGAYVREHVLAGLGGDVAMAVDYRAGLIGRAVRAPFPVHAESGPALDAIAREAAPLAIIAAYHSDHAPLARAVLEANPAARVFVEKPLAVELEDSLDLAERAAGGAWIDVGFNRRYAPFTAELKREAARLPRPLVVAVTVKELKLPATHWYFWPNQGTRVTGNACHWIDLLQHVLGEAPVELSLGASGDTVAVTLRYADDSLATLLATDRGADLGGVTERIEVRGGGTTLVLDDYRRFEVHGPGGTRVVRRLRRDKGHAAMYRDLHRRWRQGAGPRYPAAEMEAVGRVTHAAAELLRAGGGTRRLGAAGSAA